MKKLLIVPMAALVCLATLTSCSAAEPEPTNNAPSGDPIKIGLVPAVAGFGASIAQNTIDAWVYAVDEINANGGLLGRPVEIIRKDSDGKPETTLRSAREALNEGAEFLVGVNSTTEVLALTAQLPTMDTLLMVSNSKADALTGADCSPDAFRVNQSNAMDFAAFHDYIGELDGETWAVQGVDSVSGHDAVESFRAIIEAAGKTIIAEQFASSGATEFGANITALEQSGADSLFVVEYSADAVSFTTQAEQFDLFSKFDTVLGSNTFIEPLFESFGTGAVGVYGNLGWAVQDDNPVSADFAENWTQAFGSAPNYIHADNYLGAQTLFQAIANAETTDVDAVRSELEGMTFDSIAGEVTMRAEDHQLVRPSYIGQVIEADGKLVWDVAADATGAETSPSANPACKL